MINEINNNLYKITFYNGSKFIECETKTELFNYLINQESKGFIITGVNSMQPNGKTPKIAFRTDSEYKKLKKQNTNEKKEYKGFEYLNFHFIPESKLGKIDFNKISKCLKSDRGLGFSNYDWKKKNYKHEEFYKAMNDSEYDLFRCEENGKLYIPCQNELFEYVKNE